MSPLPQTSEFLHARTQAISPFSPGHSGTHALGPVLLVSPGVARDRYRGWARAARPAAGSLDRGRAGGAGRGARPAGGPCHPPPGTRAVVLGGCQTLGARVMRRIPGRGGGRGVAWLSRPAMAALPVAQQARLEPV